jgi:Reverse transcriptase (RNA-dependent DNA polymerase)
MGFTQRKRLDYEETFAPVAKMTSTQILLVIVAHQKLQILSIDIDNTYLHSEIDMKVYMTQPPGYIDLRYPNYVCKLQKDSIVSSKWSEFGIEQSPHTWRKLASRPLLQIHVCSLEWSTISIFISLHINDFLCIGTETNCQSTKAVLEKQFKLKSTKDIVHLGIKISRKLDGTL